MGPFPHHTPLKQGTRNHFLPRMSCFSFVLGFHSFSFLPPLCILNLVKSVPVLFNVIEIKRVKPCLFIPLNERRDAHRPRCIYQTALTIELSRKMQRFCGTESRHLEFRRSPDLLRQIRRGPGAKSWSQMCAFCDFVPRVIMSELSERTKGLPSEECSSSESVFVGYRQELVRNRKTKYNVNGRDIVIFYHSGNFHAMDQRCYRKYWKNLFII